jgi:hypothetical protein
MLSPEIDSAIGIIGSSWPSEIDEHPSIPKQPSPGLSSDATLFLMNKVERPRLYLSVNRGKAK